MTDPEDDESTRIDPEMPKKASGSHAKHAPKAEEDDEATKHTGPPKLAKETKKILEESKRLNAAGGPVQPKKKMHPLVPIGVAFAILAVLLMMMNWFTAPSPAADGEQPVDERGAIRRLFDW